MHFHRACVIHGILSLYRAYQMKYNGKWRCFQALTETFQWFTIKKYENCQQRELFLHKIFSSMRQYRGPFLYLSVYLSRLEFSLFGVCMLFEQCRFGMRLMWHKMLLSHLAVKFFLFSFAVPHTCLFYDLIFTSRCFVHSLFRKRNAEHDIEVFAHAPFSPFACILCDAVTVKEPRWC